MLFVAEIGHSSGTEREFLYIVKYEKKKKRNQERSRDTAL